MLQSWIHICWPPLWVHIHVHFDQHSVFLPIGVLPSWLSSWILLCCQYFLFLSISDVGYMLLVSMFRSLTCVSPKVIYKECRTLSKLSNTATYLVIEINCNTFVFVLWLCELYFLLSNKNSLQSVWNLHILDLYVTYEMLFCGHWLLIYVLVAMLCMCLLATHLWEHHYFLSHLCELYVVNYVLMVFEMFWSQNVCCAMWCLCSFWCISNLGIIQP
jgi:hypothetical protein